MKKDRSKLILQNFKPLTLNPDTQFVMILAQKAGEEVLALDDIYPRYKTLFKMFLGVKDVLLVRGCNLNHETDAVNNIKLMNQVELAAKKIIADSHQTFRSANS